MFYYLNGELAYKDLSTCVIDCGGVGYKLTISTLTSEALASKVGTKVKLFTYLAVREDGMELFGFISDEERSSFNKLTTVSGVGPKVAMSILSVMSPERLALAICSGDTKAIAKAPGIGSKTAARIILELRDKMSAEFTLSDAQEFSAAVNASAPKNKNLAEATEALMSLGYDKSTVINALSGIDTAKTDVGEIIRLALKKLAR
jgi:Holliday junction DNA helicase RuvA